MQFTLDLGGLMMTLVAGAFALLLGMLAVFLKRLLDQIDGMRAAVTNLNSTLIKLEGDVGGKIRVLETKQDQFGFMWKKVESLEESIATLNEHCRAKGD